MRGNYTLHGSPQSAYYMSPIVYIIAALLGVAVQRTKAQDAGLCYNGIHEVAFDQTFVMPLVHHLNAGLWVSFS